MHVNALLGPRLHPTVRGAAAWEHKRVASIRINNGEIEITVVWGCSNRLPFHQLQLLHDRAWER
jgi:hypothetical protein